MTSRDDKRHEDVLDVRNQMAAQAIQWERTPGNHNGVTIAEELRAWIDRLDEAMASAPSHVAEKRAVPYYACEHGVPGNCGFCAAMARGEKEAASAPSTTPQKTGPLDNPHAACAILAVVIASKAGQRELGEEIGEQILNRQTTPSATPCKRCAGRCVCHGGQVSGHCANCDRGQG